jgi:putative ABC transport system permease protein
VTRPPRFARWLTATLAPPAQRDELLGDLAELWQIHLSARPGGRRAYWRHALSLIWWARRTAVASAAGPAPGGGRRTSRVAHDLRYAWRLARRQPVFTAVAVATLALGIAAATAIFTICDRVLLQPLPYGEPDRIVVLDNVPFGFTTRGMSVPRFIAENSALSAVGLYAPGGLNLGDPDTPMRIPAAAVTNGFFAAMGSHPLVGRTMTADEDRDGTAVAILSFALWQHRFGADPSVVGRQVRLNSRAFTIVGVMPRGFSFPAEAMVWVPVGADPQITGAAIAPVMIARLAPGVGTAQAADALARGEAAQRAPDPGDERPVVTPLHEELVGGSRPHLLLLAVLVALLLAATSANVAGLLLARLRVRQRELSLRAALGASRGRLAAQMAVECAAMAAAGAALGLMLAFWILRAFEAAAPTFAPHVNLSSPGVDVLAVAIGVTAASTLLFGIGPAVAVLRRPPAELLREGAAATRRTRWFGRSLVVVQIALALVLLAGTSATLGVLIRLSRIDLGFENQRAIVFELTLPFSRYQTTAAVSDLLARLEASLGSIPGVAGVGTTDYAPGSAQTGIGMPVVDAREPVGEGRPTGSSSLLMATPGYFRAMGVRLIAGRAFTARDTDAGPKVAILSAAAARALASDPAAAVGRQIHDRFRRKAGPIEVVGVVADVRLRRRMTGTQSQIYVPTAQSTVRGSAAVVIDGSGDADATIAHARQILHGIDPDLPIYSVVRIADLRARFLATERVTVAMTAAFGALSLLLAAIGLYGLLAQIVSHRRREIGIRMALGADRRRLMRGVVGASLGYAALGCAAGGAALAGGLRAVTAIVPSFAMPSAGVLAVNVLVLIAACTLAAWQPARRASRVDPLIALRGD